jgi:hypothetical protein
VCVDTAAKGFGVQAFFIDVLAIYFDSFFIITLISIHAFFIYSFFYLATLAVAQVHRVLNLKGC